MVIKLLDVNFKKIFIMFLVTFVFVAIIIPVIKKIAFHISAIDIPNERKVHKKPMPRLGGLGIYCGFLLGYMRFCENTYMMNSILIGSFILIITGIIDDIKPIKPFHKLLGQLIASLIVVFYGDVLLHDVSFFGIYLDFGAFSYPLTVLFILGCINCMNFIDGLDGLAGGISSIFFLTIGIIAFFQFKIGLASSLAISITFIMLGSTGGFLIHNFYPAKIFMGDTGSMFLGYMMAIITLLGFKSVMMSSMIIPLFILIVPILDTLFAIIRRKIKGESVTMPDKSHIHHLLLKKNFTQRQTVLIIYLITILFSLSTIIYTLLSQKIGMIMYFVLMFMFIIFLYKLGIIFSKEKDKIL